jgi:hypothetical protein
MRSLDDRDALGLLPKDRLELRVINLFRQALEAGSRRDYESAANILTRILSETDEVPEALLYLGRSLHSLGDFGKAIGAFRLYLRTSSARPEGWCTPAQLSMKVDVKALTEPHYAANGAHGHFEQSIHATGSLTIGGEEIAFDGYGVRDKSWGPRNWGGSSAASGGAPMAGSTPAAPNPFVFWFSMNFGPEVSMGGSCFRRADGAMKGEGWIQDGEVMDTLKDVVVETTFRPGSILHDAVSLTGRTGKGRDIRVEGKVLNMCPTKIPFPGGATFVNEGLAKFVMAGREGFGIAESWHNVTE